MIPQHIFLEKTPLSATAPEALFYEPLRNPLQVVLPGGAAFPVERFALISREARNGITYLGMKDLTLPKEHPLPVEHAPAVPHEAAFLLLQAVAHQVISQGFSSLTFATDTTDWAAFVAGLGGGEEAVSDAPVQYLFREKSVTPYPGMKALGLAPVVVVTNGFGLADCWRVYLVLTDIASGGIATLTVTNLHDLNNGSSRAIACVKLPREKRSAWVAARGYEIGERFAERLRKVENFLGELRGKSIEKEPFIAVAMDFFGLTRNEESIESSKTLRDNIWNKLELIEAFATSRPHLTQADWFSAIVYVHSRYQGNIFSGRESLEGSLPQRMAFARMQEVVNSSSFTGNPARYIKAQIHALERIREVLKAHPPGM